MPITSSMVNRRIILKFLTPSDDATTAPTAAASARSASKIDIAPGPSAVVAYMPINLAPAAVSSFSNSTRRLVFGTLAMASSAFGVYCPVIQKSIVTSLVAAVTKCILPQWSSHRCAASHTTNADHKVTSRPGALSYIYYESEPGRRQHHTFGLRRGGNSGFSTQ